MVICRKHSCFELGPWWFVAGCIPLLQKTKDLGLQFPCSSGASCGLLPGALIRRETDEQSEKIYANLLKA